WLLRALSSTLFPYTTLFRSSLRSEGSLPQHVERFFGLRLRMTVRQSVILNGVCGVKDLPQSVILSGVPHSVILSAVFGAKDLCRDRKSTRLNSSHVKTSYAV